MLFVNCQSKVAESAKTSTFLLCFCGVVDLFIEKNTYRILAQQISGKEEKCSHSAIHVHVGVKEVS